MQQIPPDETIRATMKNSHANYTGSTSWWLSLASCPSRSTTSMPCSRRRAAREVLNRMGKPDEIAEAFLFLASDRSRFATDSVMTVDGGSSIGNHLVE